MKSARHSTEASAQHERRRQLRGLLLLALAIILLTILRAGPHRIFPHAWWHVW